MKTYIERLNEFLAQRESNTGTVFTEADQIEHETRMIEEGVARFYKQYENALSKNTLSKVPAGTAMIKTLLPKMIEGIDEAIKEGNYLITSVSDLSSPVLAYLTLSTVVDGLAGQKSLLETARNLAEAIRMELRLQYWLEDNGKVAKSIIKRANKKTTRRHKFNGLHFKMNKDGIRDADCTLDVKVKLGAAFIDVLINKTGIVKLSNGTVTHSHGKVRKEAVKIVPDEATKEWLQDANTRLAYRNPKKIPYLIPPKDWESFDKGYNYNPAMTDIVFIKQFRV